EGLVRGALADRAWRDELAAHQLVRLQSEGPVVAGAVDHPVHVGVFVGPAEREELVERRLDAQLLCQLACGAGRELLSGQQDAAGAGVPVRGVDVLAGGAQVDEEVAAAVEHQDVGAAMRQAACAHLASRDGAGGPAGGVEAVDQLGAGVTRSAQPSASSNLPPSAASSSGVFTLSRLRAAPSSARSSSSST